MKPISIIALFLLVGGSLSPLLGQTMNDSYSIGINVVKDPQSSCPAFIGGVYPKSPAALAGLRPGDKLLKVNDTDVSSFNLMQISQSLRSNHPGNVSLLVERNHENIPFTIGREKYSMLLAKNGTKIVEGAIVPIDEPASEQAEKMQTLRFDPDHVDFRVFPLHYPPDQNRFYGGFEIYVLREPSRAIVGGIETSPASRAGLHWGDTIVAVDDVSLAGKSLPELEQLFSSNHASITRLTIDRNGAGKTITYTLARASDVLRENGKRMYKTRLVPSGVADEDLHCFHE
jgi:C-terminal processing protease CtpA/Prc